MDTLPLLQHPVALLQHCSQVTHIAFHFQIPLNVTGVDTLMCAIKRGTALAKVINDCHAIIVDEAPMRHRLAFQAVNQTLRDVTCNDCPMGGMPTCFCGDFRQILPVIPYTWHTGQHCRCITAEVLPVAVLHSHAPPHKHESSPSE